MSSTAHMEFAKSSSPTQRNARTLRAYMALQNVEIAQRIKDLRGARGNPPQPIVAAAMGIALRTYQKWEAGDAKPEYRNLERLAEYYGVTEEYILTGNENVVRENPVTVSSAVELVRDEFREKVERHDELLAENNQLLQQVLQELDAAHLERDVIQQLLDEQTALLAELREEQNVLNAAQRVLATLEAHAARLPEQTNGDEHGEAPPKEDRRRGDRRGNPPRHDEPRRTG